MLISLSEQGTLLAWRFAKRSTNMCVHRTGSMNLLTSMMKGWDWGPALLTCGPWRPISLEVYTSSISDLFCSTHVDQSLQWAELTARCEVDGKADEVLLEVVLQGRKVSCATAKVVNGLASASFRTQNPELWYPARYGRQPLYELKATLLSERHVCDTKSKYFGLRRVEVIQREVRDAPGTSFFFRINGIPMFCGGSNWIPADSFIPRIKPSRYRDWIKLAVAGNQSMIRIWGGGIFEEHALYDACDELGVLVWVGRFPCSLPDPGPFKTLVS